MMKHALICFLFGTLLSVQAACADGSSPAIGPKLEWQLQSEDKTGQPGEVISTPAFQLRDWLPALVPGTVLGTLVERGGYGDLFMGDNLARVAREPFQQPWWYRAQFTLPADPGHQTVWIEFDGINYRANIWLNGARIAAADTTAGAYRRFRFDVSATIRRDATNVLAVQVFPPLPGEPSIGFVDWNPKPPDRSMGLWREVRVLCTGAVAIAHPFVQARLDLKSLRQADLTITAELKNSSDKLVEGILQGEIGKIRFRQKLQLRPREQKLVIFPPEQFPQLRFANPKLWWPNGWGKANLYTLKLAFDVDHINSDITLTRFGIRDVADYFNDQGHRGYKINGQPILIRGGGWTDDIFLRQNSQNLRTQIAYARQMNLNAIRVELFWGESQELYDLCDENGILVMAGWSAQWEWEGSFGKPCNDHGGIQTREDMALVVRYWQDQIRWLRNHPSIFVWAYGSDKIPRPELEKMYITVGERDDPTRPCLSAASWRKSAVTGPTGVKMNGPYDYVPPVYWYEDTSNGGAFGFNTETGPGPQVPPLESIKRFIPAGHYWPPDSIWNYHCGGNDFNTLDRYNQVLGRRMGAPTGLEDYVRKAQFMNYEAMRAMFEAFVARRPLSTGIIQWMYNSAWPKFWWQLYDYYLTPNGAFYGARIANAPLHLLYDYANGAVIAANNTLDAVANIEAQARVYDLNLKELQEQEQSLTLPANQVQRLFAVTAPETGGKPWLLRLRLLKGNKLLEENVYVLSPRVEKLAWEKSNWFVTPQTAFADFSALQELPAVKPVVTSQFKKEGGKWLIEVEIKNPANCLAFQLVPVLRRSSDGQALQPVFWDDAYFSLWPGERRAFRGFIYERDLHGEKPRVEIEGWNVR